jgi:hypothetical protein
MRALAGPAMLLVMAGTYLAYHLSSKEDAPSREFTELEFAGADEEHTGSCYSLSTVLIANRAFSGAVRTWSSPRKDEWTLALDSIVQGNGGPLQISQKFTFEKSGEQVRLVWVEASEKMPTDLKLNIDALLENPRALNSTPVERCQKEGATGYLFTAPRR